MLSGGEYGIIESIEKEELSTPEETYNFEVAEYHTYYVGDNGVLVHNLCDSKSVLYDDLLPDERAAYDGYSAHGWQGNFPGQQKGTNAGRRYANSNGYLPAGNYKEFDINPPGALGRDAKRFVVGEGNVYLTRNHYATFFRVIK